MDTYKKVSTCPEEIKTDIADRPRAGVCSRFVVRQPTQRWYPVNKHAKHIATVATVLGGVVVVGALYVVHGTNAKLPSTAVAAAPVTAVVLHTETVQVWSEFSGRINAVDYAEIRPQVAGRITEIRFHDGQHVNAGDVLFVIDPRPFEAAVAKAEGDLASAQSAARLAKIERDRGEKLVKLDAMAQETVDQRANADVVAQATVQSAQGVLAAARVDLDNAYIKAPISGRISRAEITVGNLVGSAATPPALLASVVSDNGVYADFEVDEQTYLNSLRARAQSHQPEQATPVDLIVQGDHDHVYHGTIESFDNRINSTSGTIRARARFANEDGSLIPGMFVTVRMGGTALSDALLVSDKAIGNDQSKRFVFVADTESKAEYQPVQLGDEVNGRRVIAAGLKPGDRVILDGLQRLAPGESVAVQIVAPQTASN
jgi:membrane fusion protein, multidrug efflux system